MSDQPKRLEQQLLFIVEIDKLKQILRRTTIMGGSRCENSAEHSWHLAMMALTLAEYAPGPIDALHVLRLLLVHDLVEIDAGDTFCYDAEAALSAVRARRPEAYVRSAGASILPSALGDPALLAALLGEVTTESSPGAPGAPCAPDEPYTSIRMMGPGGDMLGAFQVLTRTGEVRAVRPCDH